MIPYRWMAAGALVIVVGAAGVAQWRDVAAQRSDAYEKGGADETGPYQVVLDWPRPLHADRTWGRTAAILPETADRVFATQTSELPVIHRPDTYDGGAPVRQT